MSTLRKFRKNVTGNSLMFPVDMYENCLGSLVITNYILSEDKPNINEIKKTWKRIKKTGLDFWLDDEEFIPKSLKMFSLSPKYGLFAMVVSEYNTLFAPFVEGELLPIREDGMLTRTLRNGKIYPVEEKNE